MTKELGKIDSVISEKRIKLHIFEPSQRKIWTIVGKEKEYWLYPEMNFVHAKASTSTLLQANKNVII